MKKNSFTIENRNIDVFFKTDLAKNGQKNYITMKQKFIFDLKILFYNFLENFSSIWSFLGHLCKKLKTTKFAHFTKISIENSLIIQECG